MQGLTEEQIDLLVERLVRRTEKANTFFLEQIGEAVKEIRKLSPTQAQQLVQILKYQGNYEEIVQEISKQADLNMAEVDEIFEEYAKKDYQFSKQFYDYRNIPFIEYSKNDALRKQTLALAKITKGEMYNFTRSRAIGYSIRDLQDNVQFLGLRETYEKVLDEALLNVGQGVDTFDNAMSRIMKDIGGSGLKYLDYESGRSIRLDSMVRMHLKSGLRELHNEIQTLVGGKFGANGVEISVHLNPADDHAEVQGRQFSNEEYEKLQKTGIATDFTGKNINLHKKLKQGKLTTFRPISEYNCYHYVFSIVLGMSEPDYTEEQLQKIIDDNEKGFEYEGQKYSMYEGTQLQRKLETAIRKQKDIQIIGRASDNKELIKSSQEKITILTQKYKELSDVSGLPTKMKRMRVAGYRRVSVK